MQVYCYLCKYFVTYVDKLFNTQVYYFIPECIVLYQGSILFYCGILKIYCYLFNYIVIHITVAICTILKHEFNRNNPTGELNLLIITYKL